MVSSWQNRKIVTGGPGAGKSRFFIGPFIKKYKGKVIWIHSIDGREYLGLQNDVQGIQLEQIENVDDFKKLSIIMPPDSITSLEMERKLKAFLKPYEKQKETALVIEDLGVLIWYMPYLLHNESDMEADINIVIQDKDFLGFPFFERVSSKGCTDPDVKWEELHYQHNKKPVVSSLKITESGKSKLSIIN